VLAPKGLPLNGRVFGRRFSWRHRGPQTPYLRDAIVGNAEEYRPRNAMLDSVLPAIVHPALYAAWPSRPRWHAALMSLTQVIEAKPRKELCDDGAGARWPQPPPFCVGDRSRMAETRRRRGSGAAESAARRATPYWSATRSSSKLFSYCPQVKRAHGVCLPHHPSARASSSRPKRRASVDLSHEAAVVLESANRINAETPTSAPPMKQNICRQIAEGIASWVTPWTSA
jgi:hypothetical protein